jgi:hypothetical protein
MWPISLMMFIRWSIAVRLMTRHRWCRIKPVGAAHRGWRRWTSAGHETYLGARLMWIFEAFIHTWTIFTMSESALFAPGTFVDCFRVITAFNVNFLHWSHIHGYPSWSIHVDGTRTSWMVVHLRHHHWWHTNVVAGRKSIIVISRKLVLVWRKLRMMHTRMVRLIGRKVSPVMMVLLIVWTWMAAVV